MGNRNHEWIQKFRHYEAVLRCTNELGGWDRDQTLRAYQTWGFDDATTNGNDLSFGHIDTGVLVLHDGDVVAIQYGEGEMVKALADLFTTLHALGWKTAEVYHRQESMDALLTDMGKAIPGHLDFDVHPARETASAAEDSEEAAQVMELGLNLMQGVATTAREAEEFNSSALSELQSMSDEDNAQQDQQIYAQLDSPLELDDGFESYAGPAVEPGTQHMQEAGSILMEPHRERIIFADDEDSMPIVPKLVQEMQVDQPITLAPDDPLESAPVQVLEAAPSPAPVSVPAPAPAPVPQPTPVQMPAEAPGVARETQSTQQIIVSPRPTSLGGQIAASDRANASNGFHIPASFSLMKLGRSAIGFDLPESPFDQSVVEEVAQEMGAREVVHVWPGLTNQAERWDLLSEIDTTAPWFAETIADELKILKPVERILFAGALKKAAADGLQMRDLLHALLDGSWVPDVLVKAMQNSVDSNALTQSVFGKLGALLLSENGEAFLDTKPADAANERQNPATFTILSARAISHDTAAKLYVVHLDACDGPFVRTVVSLMMEVAQRYAKSMRNSKKAEAQKAKAIEEEQRLAAIKKQEAFEKTQGMLTALALHMKEAGLDMSQMQSLMPV